MTSLALTAARGWARLRNRPQDDPDPAAMLAALDPARAGAPPPRRLLRRYRQQRYVVRGRPVLRLEPRQASAAGPRAELVYLHGGGYLFPMSDRQWATLAWLAETTGANLTVPAYGLAPEHQVDAALALLDEVMDGVHRAASAPRERNLSHPRSRVVVAGNSAGGGLALAHAIRSRDRGGPAADALVLFFPWVEASMTNPAAKALEPRDVTLRCVTLAAAARCWAGPRELTDPMVSPLSDHLGGLPPLHLYQGDHDIFLPDVQRFAAKAQAAGTPTRLTVYPGAHHAYVGDLWVPETRRTLADAARVITGGRLTGG